MCAKSRWLVDMFGWDGLNACWYWMRKDYTMAVSEVKAVHNVKWRWRGVDAKFVATPATEGEEE